jgi:hypothetical protein
MNGRGVIAPHHGLIHGPPKDGELSFFVAMAVALAVFTLL